MRFLKLFFIFFLVVLPSFISGQTNDLYDEFLSIFETKTLPITITYSPEQEKKIAGEYIIYEEGDSIVDDEYIQPDDDYYLEGPSLPVEMVKRYLLDNDENEFFYFGFNDSIVPNFLPICKIVEEQYYLIIFEKRFNPPTSTRMGSKKYIVSVDKKGTFISKILIASCAFQHSVRRVSMGRYPWFPLYNGSVSLERKILFKDEHEYRILESGEILEKK